MATQGLIDALLESSPYPHPVSSKIELMQTHLSWIILTGDFAYKIKKPLNLGFNDFTTLEKRKYYCNLELSLNQNLLKEMYLEVVPISGSAESPEINGQGPIIEYAIKMKQFSQDDLLSHIIKREPLRPEWVKALAQSLASFHQVVPICDPEQSYGSLESIIAPVKDNFKALKELKAGQPYIKDLNDIEQYTLNQFERLKPIFIRRKNEGFIRACHGDVHLGNIVLWKGEPRLFDCIEFNESFRWTDVISDVAFLVMDLRHKKQDNLAHLFCNRYIEHTGDFQGAQLLSFYVSYRAMVRAKVSAFVLQQLDKDNPQVKQIEQELSEFIQLAKEDIHPAPPSLSVTIGPSGCGKSTFSEQKMTSCGAIRLRSDVIRKHMFQLDPFKKSSIQEKNLLYRPEITEKVYHTLKDTAASLIKNQQSVIIDAACLKSWQRKLFIDLAQELNIPLCFYQFDVPFDELKRRIQSRQVEEDFVSDANLDVLNQQIASLEPLNADEKNHAKVINA